MRQIFIKEFFIIIVAVHISTAQDIYLDKGLFVGGLWCFPTVNDTLVYKYLPNDVALALDRENFPQFSFIRYTNSSLESLPNAAQESSLSNASGGSVLHFLITYFTEPEKISEAQELLRQRLGNSSLKISAPVIFKSGRYALVSSILNQTSGHAEISLLAAGKAPLLEGSRIALSVEMSPKYSTLLLESLKMPTPDISVVFDFEFSGISSEYRAEIAVDWSQYYRRTEKGAGATISIPTYFQLGTDVRQDIEKQIKNEAIKIKILGDNPGMDGLTQMVIQKLIHMLYEEIPVESTNPQDPLVESLAEAIKYSAKDLAKSIFPFSGSVIYKHKQTKREGSSQILLQGRYALDRHYSIVFNVGPIYTRYGSNTNIFKTVSLEDPTFIQREIGVNLDGDLIPEFKNFINSVTVQFRKTHGDNTQTYREIVLTKANLNQTNTLTYGFAQDHDRLQWLEYEYRILYDFSGGKKYNTSWTSQSNAIINVYVPFRRYNILFDGDTQWLKEQQIRAIVIKIEYGLFSQKFKEQITIRPQDDLSNLSIPVTLPHDDFKYSYHLLYIYKNGTEKNVSGESVSDYLFIDQTN